MQLNKQNGAENRLRRSAAVCAVLMGATQGATASTLTEALGSGKAIVDLRLRYESVDQSGLSDKASAVTLRSRLGYLTGDYMGFGAYLEMDDVTAMKDDTYNDATGVTPYTQYPVIADPEGTEVNQAYLSYSGIADTTLKYGRQRVILDNARFIGNVGWRQNEQTYDAFSVVNKSLPDTTLVYGYVTNVNRIFGELSPKSDIDTKTHLINANYKGFEAGAISAYGYFLDTMNAASNQTVGLRFSGATAVGGDSKMSYTAEYAKQSDYKEGAATIDADYTLAEIGMQSQGIAAKLGYELLSGDGTYAFSTPLATLHAFNGWADMFLATPANGLEDLYVSVEGKVAATKLVVVYHDFSADKGGAAYGSEIDLLAVKKFGKHYTVLAKYASYSADTYKTDTDKFWLMGEAKF